MTPPLSRRRRPIPAPCSRHRLTAKLRQGLPAAGEHVAASYQSHHSPVAELLRHGVDPATRDATMRGWTALHWSAHCGHWIATKTLLCNGTDPDIEDDTGETPLHLATHKGATATLDRLIGAGANPHSRSHTGLSPLHEAASYGNADGVALLLAARADPNATDNAGNTPLHLAARGGPPWYPIGHAKCIALLLAAGADPARCNHRGQQPSDTAHDTGNPDLALLLYHRSQPPAGDQPKEVTT